ISHGRFGAARLGQAAELPRTSGSLARAWSRLRSALRPVTPIVSLDLAGWRACAPEEQQTAIRTLEGGGVLLLPRLAFELSRDERRFLSPAWSNDRAKNVSLEGEQLKGARGGTESLAALA